MRTIINSEYRFTKNIGDKEIGLTVYIYYDSEKYDIVQDGQEGIFARSFNQETKINTAFMELAIEALKFIESKLYLKQKK